MTIQWRTKEWLEEHYITKGMTWVEIGKMVGRSDVAVISAAKKFGIQSRTISEIRRALRPELTKEALLEYYVNKGLSTKQIAKDFGVSQSVIWNRLKFFNIPTRARNDAVSNFWDSRPGVLPKKDWATVSWLVDQYSNGSIADISELTGWSHCRIIEIMDSLGVTRRTNSQSIQRKADSISARMRQLWNDPGYRRHILAEMRNQPRLSKIQMALYNYLDELGVTYIKECEQTYIGWYSFDCLIPKTLSMRKNLLIEVQGYWHRLPKTMQRDRSKFTFIDRYYPEHELMYVWDYEFDNKTGVLDRIRAKLGMNLQTNDFDFNDIIVRKCELSEVKSFLDAYHYVGGRSGGWAYGAWLRDELIACALLIPPRRQNLSNKFGTSEILEIARLCIHPSRHKKNFGSWFLRRVLNNCRGKLIVAYADKTTGHTGGVYKASNFILHHNVAPDYWYVGPLGQVIHKKTLYNKAISCGMTERDYSDQHNLMKKFGGEKLCYIKDLR